MKKEKERKKDVDWGRGDEMVRAGWVGLGGGV